MIFSLQSFIEDHFERRALRDVDQYAVNVVNVYGKERWKKANKPLLEAVYRIRTIFFKNNSQLDRRHFESSLVSLLNSRFTKQVNSQSEEFPGGVVREKHQLRRHARLSMTSVIDGFKRATEARAIDCFWKSRRARKLRPTPEKIGQGLFVMFTEGTLGKRGLTFREVLSGAGFVDFVVLLSRTPHLIELKIMRDRYEGATQLGTYMETESRKEGWLVLFDARAPARKTSIPLKTRVRCGVITNIIVDINPVSPSRVRA